MNKRNNTSKRSGKASATAIRDAADYVMLGGTPVTSPALGFICITKGKEHFGVFTVHPNEPEAMTEAARLAAKENKPVMVCAVLGTMRVGEPKFHREAT